MSIYQTAKSDLVSTSPYRQHSKGSCFITFPRDNTYSQFPDQGSRQQQINTPRIVVPRSHHQFSQLHYSPSYNPLDAIISNSDTLLPAFIALVLVISAQTFINSMLKGDRGLGAYLSDGSGYKNSKFRPLANDKKKSSSRLSDDPLPWLKLPKLDFVEVAGQNDDYNEEDVRIGAGDDEVENVNYVKGSHSERKNDS